MYKYTLVERGRLRKEGIFTNMSIHSSSVLSITRVNLVIRDLVAFLFDLSPLDLEVLLFLIKINPESSTLEELSEKADRDKSTTFRSLQKLANQRIVSKETKTLKERGYYHVYASMDKESFKTEVEKRITDLKKSLDILLKNFEVDLDTALLSS
jgi:predicted transcriptional regulator